MIGLYFSFRLIALIFMVFALGCILSGIYVLNFSKLNPPKGAAILVFVIAAVFLLLAILSSSIVPILFML